MSIHGVNARQLQIISILKEAKCTNTAELQEELGDLGEHLERI